MYSGPSKFDAIVCMPPEGNGTPMTSFILAKNGTQTIIVGRIAIAARRSASFRVFIYAKIGGNG